MMIWTNVLLVVYTAVMLVTFIVNVLNRTPDRRTLSYGVLWPVWAVVLVYRIFSIAVGELFRKET